MTGTNKQSGRRAGLLVQERDREILAQLFIMRTATRDQIKRVAGFGSITRINTRLLALYRARLLRRFFIGFGAGRMAAYSLSPKGAMLIGVSARGPRAKQNELLAMDFSLLHQLAINDVYCNLRFRPAPAQGISFVKWMPFTQPIAENLRLIPDGYVEFRTPARIDASFLEVDLGTEELKVWKEKARQYLALAMSGEFARTFHQPRFRVFVLVNSSRRLQYIRAAVAEVTQKIFWFAVLGEVQGDRFFDSIWLRPTGDTHQPLFEQPK
jgi:hypothetical protein